MPLAAILVQLHLAGRPSPDIIDHPVRVTHHIAIFVAIYEDLCAAGALIFPNAHLEPVLAAVQFGVLHEDIILLG